MLVIKKNLRNIKTSSTLEINEVSNKLKKQGKEVFKFGLGQSPFPVPNSLVSELKKRAHEKNYLNVSGLLELRDKIAKYHTKKNKNRYHADNVIIGPGSKELMFSLHMLFDGEVLLPAPSWVSYKPQAILGRNKVHFIETEREKNWFPSAESIEKIVSINKNKNYLLFLNSPNNPSGLVCENLEEIAEVVKKYKILILSDEIYSDLTYESEYRSISEFCPNQTIISNGLSKWCGAGGWRLGYFVIPDSLSHLRDSIKVLASETFSSVSGSPLFVDFDSVDFDSVELTCDKGIPYFFFSSP